MKVNHVLVYIKFFFFYYYFKAPMYTHSRLKRVTDVFYFTRFSQVFVLNFYVKLDLQINEFIYRLIKEQCVCLLLYPVSLVLMQLSQCKQNR